MARIFMDGFEDGSIGLWDSSSAPVITSGMDGNYCLRLYGGTYWVQKNLPAAGEYYFAFWYNSQADNGERVLEVRSGTTTLCSLWRTNNSSGNLKAYSGYGSSLLATGTATTPTSTTRKIGVYIKIDDSAGRFKVTVDGATDIDFTGDTKPGTETTMDNVVLGARSGEPNANFDTFIVDSTTMPTGTKIQGIAITGAGNSTQYDPSTGSNYACVDEIPYSDTDYVSTNTADEIDTYILGNLTGSVGEIKGVQVQARALYEGAAAVTKLDLVIRTNSTNYTSTDKSLTTSYVGYTNIWELNPNGSVVWTESTINDIEIGIKAKA
jgi:hypothetical protein